MNHRVIRKPPEPKKPVDAPVDEVRRPLPVTILDWTAFFRTFCESHQVRGGGYVLDGDRLLFGDGWTCALDHKGPYWEPPNDAMTLRALLVRYWRRRWQIVRGQAKVASDALEGLDELSRNYPLPLQAKRILVTEAGALALDPVQPNGPIDWMALAARLKWLQQDVLDCEAELISLGERP